ncbi:efflux transporter, outer membrane factor (OMF) lipoprotein, NodT family [Variovorax sp. OV329]|nr:efflux transporter, outer membrane factor (OMF) lipoprotein, NodT family [Variovorax sp. OV329]
MQGGCTVLGPDFSSPTVPWLPAWSSSAQQALPADPKAKAQPDLDAWWTNFDDPVLTQLVAQAQRQNTGVRIAGMRILESRALLGIAGSGLYPQLQEVSASALRTGQRQSRGTDSAFWSAGAGFDIAWEIDFWGKYRRGIESADAAYFASIAQYDDMQVLVAAQAASLYGSIRTTEQRLYISHENAAIQKRSLEITQNLFRSGNESELDVQQARSQYLGTLATIPDLESALRQTHNALNVLLARPPGPLPELEVGRGKIPQASLGLIVEVPAELLRRRPDVRAAEMLLAAQSAQIGISEAALYPSIALGGSIGLSATSLAASPSTLSWAVGPALVWNVFDHGRLSNQVLVQDARFQQLNEQYQDTVLRAARETDDAAVAFASSRTQVDILQEAVRAARRSLDIANIQYQEGLIDFQRVLDSQRTLFSQQERLVSTQGSVVQNLVALYKALGGGWQAGRELPLLDEDTRRTLRARSDWKTLIDDPLPPPAAQLQPPRRHRTP